MGDTAAAIQVAKANSEKGRGKALQHGDVHKRALEDAHELGIHNPSEAVVRAFYQLQFGKYRGQTFQWLLGNATGYACYIINSMRKEGGSMPDTPIGDNKRHLKVCFNNDIATVFWLNAMHDFLKVLL